MTWDSLNGDGSPAISFSGVADYLNSVGYQVHLVWDPVTGDIIQLLPANVGGAGLRHSGPPETNNMGSVNIQIEAYFTPGVVRNGVRYPQLTDTPMVRLDDILAWADGWGIPRIAPLSPGNRNANIWVNEAGHYGHFNVPGNDHSDPIVPIEDILAHGSTPHPPQGEWMPGSLALVNVNSRKVLDIAGGANTSGSSLIQWTLHGGPGQLWLPEVVKQGIVFHPVNNPGLALDADRGGGPVTVWNNDPSADWQIWDQAYIHGDGAAVGDVVLVNRHTGKALDVLDMRVDAGAPVGQYERNDQLNQRWTYVEVG